MNDLRLELRARNNVLWHAIHDNHATVAAFCRAHGMSQSVIGGFLNLTRSPYLKNGRPSKAALEICKAVAQHEDDLFPRTLYDGVIEPSLVAEVSSDRFRSLKSAQHLALPPAQDSVVFGGELRAALESLLKTLTPRMGQIIRARYGLDDGEERTRAEIAERYHLSQARIAQIEAAALRRLRHPSRSRELHGFLYSDIPFTEREP